MVTLTGLEQRKVIVCAQKVQLTRLADGVTEYDM